MTIHNHLAPTLAVRTACFAGFLAWFCPLMGIYIEWRNRCGRFDWCTSDGWDVLGYAFSFFTSLWEMIPGGTPSPLEITLALLSLLLAAVAVFGAWRSSKERSGTLRSLAIGLGVTFLVLAIGTLSLQAIIWLWLKDADWR